MVRRYLGVVLGTLLLLALVPSSSQAHVVSAGTSLGIGKTPRRPVAEPGKTATIYGRLRSAELDCRVNQRVILFRRRPGPDRRVGSDITDGEGEYRFLRKVHRPHVVYTRFLGSVRTSYGHSHTCGPSTSRILRLRILPP